MNIYTRASVLSCYKVIRPKEMRILSQRCLSENFDVIQENIDNDYRQSACHKENMG